MAGTGGTGGGETGGTGGATGGTGGDTGGAGGAPACSIQSPDPACNGCITGACLTQCNTCANSQACVSLLQCLINCTTSTCQNNCANQYPSGIDDFMSFLGVGGCVDTQCATPCGGGGTGGTGGSTGGSGGGTGGSGGTIDGHACSVTDPSGSGSEPSGIIPVCCSPTSSEKALIDEVFVLLNEHRGANGIGPLSYDNALESAIQGHCIHMSIHSFFSHTAPESAVSSPWTRASMCGTSANAENIAMGQSSPEDVMQSWLNSPGHSANMLNGDLHRVGIGYADGYWGQIVGN
jgi:hypothetical protein